VYSCWSSGRTMMKISATAASHRERLALRLLQNWTAQHPTDGGQATSTTPTASQAAPTSSQSATTSAQPSMAAVVDDSLTSLTWLQNLNVIKLAPGSSALANTSGRTTTTTTSGGGNGGAGHVTGNHRPTGAVQPMMQQQNRKSSLAAHHAHVDPNAILDMTGGGGGRGSGACRVKSEPVSPASSVERSRARKTPQHGGVSPASDSPPLPRLSPPPPPRCGDHGEQSPPLPALQRTDPATTTTTKPNHSYATLICMAMNDAPDRRVTLSSIYTWILDNFPYYRTADPSWQVIVRNLQFTL